jgi:DNA polymerase-1
MLAVPREERTVYAGKDAIITRLVAFALYKLVSPKKKLLNYFRNFTMPALDVLFDMEETGAFIDEKKLPIVTKQVYDLMMKAQKDAIIAVKDLKILKDKEHRYKNKKKKNGIYLTRTELVADILFSRRGLGLPVIDRSKKTKKASMGKNVRAALLDRKISKEAETFIMEFNKFSEYHTLWSRYLKGFSKHIKEDGRIHSKYSTTKAVTGRINSADPNMMNNPKRSKSSSLIRALIVCPEGWWLVAGDESQAELRWFAHVANDETMIRIFNSSDLDIHIETAQEISGHKGKDWDKLPQDKKKSFRQGAKPVNFGVIFGMSPMGLVKYAKVEYGVVITLEQATKWIEAYCKKYTGVRPYHRRAVETTRKHGYISSPLGRRRHLPSIYAENDFISGEAERMAINHPIQSPSSDTVILAATEIKKKTNPEKVKLSMFIHDELIYLVKDDRDFEENVSIIKHEMEHPPLHRFGVKLKVPLVAELKKGHNLAEMKPLEI